MKEEARTWLEQAEADLRKAKILYNNNEFDGAAFFSQQTAEKAMKSVCIFKGFGLIKTHDLSLLGRKANAPKNILEMSILLNPFYTTSRYSKPIKFFGWFTRQRSNKNTERLCWSAVSFS